MILAGICHIHKNYLAPQKKSSIGFVNAQNVKTSNLESRWAEPL
jgi:hypothetical protein